MATPTETADGVRRAEDGDNNGDAGAQGTPALAADTIRDGLFDVQVQQPAEGQEAPDTMATPGQPRQALEALSGGGYHSEVAPLKHRSCLSKADGKWRLVGSQDAVRTPAGC